MKKIESAVLSRFEPADKNVMWAMPSGSDLISIKLFNNGKWMGTDFTVDLSPYLTKEDAQETYQPIGDYATEEWVNGLNLQPKNDETLNTENKTIPGSINELLTLINNNKNIVIFNKETLTYNSAKDAIENNKLIIYLSDNQKQLFFIYSNRILDGAIELYGGNVYSGDYNSYDRGQINVIVIHIEENDYVNENLTNFYINGGGPDTYTLPTRDKTVTLIKQRLKNNILILGNGLAWGEDLATNTINITLDTNVFFVAESVPASPNDNQKKKICLVPADTTEEGNFYTEYVWVVDDEHPDGYWEEFGTYKSEVDLTPYLKIEDAASTYLSKTEAQSAYQPVGDYATNTALNEGLAGKQPTGDYALKSDLPVVTDVPTLAADYTVPANATSREYVYNISVGATVYNITGAEGIKWADGVAPIATANSTIVVSVMNNLAVWGTF